MKNRYLLLLLVVLLSLTYFFEEVRSKRLEKEDEQRSLLFDPKELGELKSLESGGAVILYKNGTPYAGTELFPADVERVDSLLYVLSGLRIKRTIKEMERNGMDRTTLFPQAASRFIFHFEKERIQLNLGVKLPHDETFYVEIITENKTNWYIVGDDSPVADVYSEENAHNLDYKYKRIESFSLLNNHFFYSRKIFNQAFPKILQISFKNLRNRSFELFLSPVISTAPQPPKGVSFNAPATNKFIEQLESMSAKDLIMPYNSKALADEVASLLLSRDTGLNQKLKLFRKYEGANGFYLFVEGGAALYELSSQDIPLLFQNAQYFWQLSPLVNPQDKILFSIEKSGHHLEFNYDPENDSVDAEKVRLDRVRELVKALESPALSIVYPVDDDRLVNPFVIKIDKRRLEIFSVDNELFIVDPEFNFLYRYLISGKLPLSLEPSDYMMN